MRSMLYQPVTTASGTTTALYDIGITADPDYTKGGELVVDTTALTNAIQSNPSIVQALFTQQSNISYNLGGANNQSTRMSQEGLAYRLQDIINNATSTYPVQGSLIALAGADNDAPTGSSETDDNSINKQIDDIAANITEYTSQMTDKKNQLYNEFENLETAMEEMNTQSSMISSFGSGS
jgi:flagellar hook-associated protein 2